MLLLHPFPESEEFGSKMLYVHFCVFGSKILYVHFCVFGKNASTIGSSKIWKFQNASKFGIYWVILAHKIKMF
jgi:hypothetical protein